MTRIPLLAYSIASDFGCRVQAALRESGQRRWHATDRVLIELSCDLHDAARPSLQHRIGCVPSDMEEAIELDPQQVGIIFVRIFGERLSDEDTSVVDEGVHAAEALKRLRHNSFCGI